MDAEKLFVKIAEEAIEYGYKEELAALDKEAGAFDFVGKLAPKLKSFGRAAAHKGMYAKDALKGYAGKAGTRANAYLNNRAAIRGGAAGMSPGAKAWAGLDKNLPTSQLLKEEAGLLGKNKAVRYGASAAGGIIGVAGIAKIMGRLGKAGAGIMKKSPAMATSLTPSAKNKLLGVGAAAAGAGGAYALIRNRGDRRN